MLEKRRKEVMKELNERVCIQKDRSCISVTRALKNASRWNPLPNHLVGKYGSICIPRTDRIILWSKDESILLWKKSPVMTFPKRPWKYCLTVSLIVESLGWVETTSKNNVNRHLFLYKKRFNHFFRKIIYIEILDGTGWKWYVESIEDVQ